jgi:plasmid rolling circle replication initiator protein Rep
MVVAHQKNNSTRLDDFHFIHGFNSTVAVVQVESKPEICPKEKVKLQHKQSLANDVVAALCRSSDNPLMMAQAARIEKCNSNGNLFVGEDLHTLDGELYDGKGSLWACNSRLCPNCTGKLSKRSRRIIRYVFENQKLNVGENWYFVTFTMPNLNLKNISLPVIAEIMQTAWKRFSALETRAGKSPTWFQKTIRGGFKNAEFTYTANDSYNYHLHSLIVAKSSIQRDGFVKIRQQWTKALEFAFTKFDVPFEVNTGDGLAVVNVQKVSWQNREKTINELCKYVTKADSWSKIPIEQLETIVAVPRFWRMFESFGVCRQTARGMMKKTVKTSENADNEFVNQSANVNEGAYLDTKNLINRRILERAKQKRVAWRIRAKEIPLWKYKMELNVEIEAVQQYRRWQLHQKYSFATFQTLDGQVF